ncbi:MAG: hypothetical protein N2235_21100 [Fischerella sp.]|nr:hypothetical protein [Fischerella sp.]
MAVARKSDVSAQDALFSRNTHRGRRFQPMETTTEKSSPTLVPPRRQSPSQQRGSDSAPVPDLNKQATTPLWLLRLYALHRHSVIVTFLLVTTTLIVYGWTVYSQQLWSQGYRKLQNLQRYERQLTTANEVLKNKMAQEAQKPAAGLVSPSPANTIFLPPAPKNSISTPSTSEPESNTQTQQQSLTPVGY